MVSKAGKDWISKVSAMNKTHEILPRYSPLSEGQGLHEFLLLILSIAILTVAFIGGVLPLLRSWNSVQ
jgi:hypothetical protein